MQTTFKLAILAGSLALLASPAFALSAVTIADAGFSAGPGTDYGPARPLAIGTRVDVIWCGTHANWCLVDLHNKKGWLPYADLSFPKTAAVITDGGTPGHNDGGGVSAGGGGSGAGGGGAEARMNPSGPDHITITKPLNF